MEGETQVRIAGSLTAEAITVAVDRAAAAYLSIPSDELTARTTDHEGDLVVVTGTVMMIEVTIRAERAAQA